MRIAILLASLVISITAHAQSVQIASNGEQPTRTGTADQFTGNVTVTPLTTKDSAAVAASGLVTFAPGARTTWHTHPAGQWLYITAGRGWVQEAGQPRQVVSSGDAVWIPANVKHWHGATDKSAMSHVAVANRHEGEIVEWLEPVSDADYLPQG